VEEIDISKELKEFYEKNRNNKLIRNFEETINSYKGFLKIDKIPSNVIGDGIEDIPDNLGKESLKWVYEVTRYVYSFFNEKNKQNFIFSIICSKKMEVFYFNTFLLFEHSFLKFVKVDYSNLDSLVLLENYNILEYKINNRKSREGVVLNENSSLLKDVDSFIRPKIQDKISKIVNIKKEQNLLNKEQKRLKEERRLKNLKDSQTNVLRELDKDRNGIIDVIENDDFIKLFRKHQSVIKEFDKDYINHLVKISNYLKTKKSNIQKVFTEIKKTKNQSQLDENVGLLKNQIHTYEVILFHSLHIINSIVKDDLITVNEIYEEFDKLKMFRTDHEKEVSQKLSDIGDGLSNLMYSINSMERNIVSGLNTLSYVTQDGFSDLNSSLTEELQSINSNIDSGNLLSLISTYQLYNINKQTKGLIE
jgi:hypothetical protein